MPRCIPSTTIKIKKKKVSSPTPEKKKKRKHVTLVSNCSPCELTTLLYCIDTINAYFLCLRKTIRLRERLYRESKKLEKVWSGFPH
jgi:hypothetical protein